MKITDILLEVAEFPFPVDFHPAWAPGGVEKGIGVTIIKILTDEGITGIAGATGFAVEVPTFNSIKPFLIGKDPFAVEQHIQILRNVRPHGGLPWCIEIALWDIIGKASNLPLYKLWGGYQDKVKAYASTGELRPPERRIEDVHRYYEEGFQAVKLRIHYPEMKDDLKIVTEVRKAIGDKMEIMVDANQAGILVSPGYNPTWSYSRAVMTARELEKLNVSWLEEPLNRHDFKGLARLTEEVDLPIAGGEVNVGIRELKMLLDMNCYDILQPDATFSEGIFQLRLLAGVIHVDGKRFIPHTWGNGLGLVANLHLAASIPNCTHLEYPYDPPSFAKSAYFGMFKTFPEVDKEGYVQVPQGPGLGVELDEKAIVRYKK
jgi:L-alanine-DL-glutamate epimerase-like enolase superfamily enzyme